MKRLALVLAALSLAACNPLDPQTTPAPSPTPEPPQRYVVDFGEAWGGRLHYMAVVPCGDKPTSWESTFRLCDLDAVELIPVTPAVWNAYDQGDPYPDLSKDLS